MVSIELNHVGLFADSSCYVHSSLRKRRGSLLFRLFYLESHCSYSVIGLNIDVLSNTVVAGDAKSSCEASNSTVQCYYASGD